MYFVVCALLFVLLLLNLVISPPLNSHSKHHPSLTYSSSVFFLFFSFVV